MNDLLNEKPRGIKLTIIDKMDYDEFKEIADIIRSKGYTITMIDNGNAVCFKGVSQ